MKLENKRGQFFLIAAIVISAVIIGFGYVTNEVRYMYEKDNFRDYTYEIKKESAQVITYGVVSSDSKIEDFIEKLANDLKERDPEASYIFIYGSKKNGIKLIDVSLKDYTAEGSTIEGSQKNVISYITWGDNDNIIGTNTISPVSDFRDEKEIVLVNEICPSCKCKRLENCQDLNSDEYDDNCFIQNNCKSELEKTSNVNVQVGSFNGKFSFGKDEKVVFIMYKEKDGERYVSST